MKTIKVRGLVIKEYETGEADKRLLLLCKDVGRVMVYARGARKPRSKFMAAAQIFTYSDFVLAKGRGFYSLAQADVIENFYDLRKDYDRLMVAHIIVDACAKTVLEKSECNDLLRLVLKCLKNLMADKCELVSNVFFLRFFDFHGLRPHSAECAVCGIPVDEMTDGIFWSAEGTVCVSHSNSDFILSRGAVAAVSYILSSELSAAFWFEVGNDVSEELSRANKMLWECHYG
ncbi:MAG: DNA repair protein RecO [Defluviitaleaceae bacterium]|nr:DNA repair protein RecO [Defluviitaleaceae bacterium]